MSGKDSRGVKTTAARLAVRRGDFVQLRRRLLSMTWVWVAVLLVGGTILIAPARSHRYPLLTAGEIAASDVVVDRDVVLPDPESSEEKRRRASLEVLPVYQLDPATEQVVLTRLGTLITEGRRQPGGPVIDLARRLSEAGGIEITVRAAEALRQGGFSNEMEGVLREAVQHAYRLGIVADRGELLGNADRGITLRTVGSSQERVERDIYRFLEGGAPLAEELVATLGSDGALVPRGRRDPLAVLLAQIMTPNLVLDRGETLARRLRAAATVEDVSVRLPRGKVLVRRGDEVSAQSARLVAALAERNATSPQILPVAGVLILIAVMAGGWLFFLRKMSPSADEARARFGATVVVTITVLVLLRGSLFLAGSVAGGMLRDPFGHLEIYLPALPHAVGPILASLMFGLPVGILFALSQTVLVTVMIGGEVGAAVFAALSGVAGAFASERLKDRAVLARAGAVVAGVNLIVVLALVLWQGRVIDVQVTAAQAGSAVFGGVFAAVLASFMLPLLESLTGTVTDIRLLELANPNLPLLRRLATEAPGTFQHSLAMANLAEAAAEAVGANPLLARVCCYYHDIGKLLKPEYFVENQRADNPHDSLTPWMSSLVVSNHVKAGLELARQYRLPEPVRDAIATHHGTKVIQYFYSRAKEKEDRDHGEVQQDDFRYQGPRPKSKEMGILLLADAIEAASRTLQEPTPGRLQGLIDQITKSVLEDGQLDDCDLTLKDIEKIGAEFFWVLSNAFHHRIDYPGFDFNRRRRG